MYNYPGLRHPNTFRSSEADRIAYQNEQNKINLATYKRNRKHYYVIKFEPDRRITARYQQNSKENKKAKKQFPWKRILQRGYRRIMDIFI